MHRTNLAGSCVRNRQEDGKEEGLVRIREYVWGGVGKIGLKYGGDELWRALYLMVNILSFTGQWLASNGLVG